MSSNNNKKGHTHVQDTLGDSGYNYIGTFCNG